MIAVSSVVVRKTTTTRKRNIPVKAIIAGRLETGAANKKVHAAPGSIPRCNRPDKIGIAGI
jgi:hypothetical protein